MLIFVTLYVIISLLLSEGDTQVRRYSADSAFFYFERGRKMNTNELIECMERAPVIAAVRQEQWAAVLESPVEVIFHLRANIMTVQKCIEDAHARDKKILIHIDLAEGIGKDKSGIEYLVKCGVDGIISTRAQLIRIARDMGIPAVQRFFALDSQGLDSISDMLENYPPDLIEIMPGALTKVIERFSNGSIPVIAGGLIENKAEVTGAINSGAAAVSTGKKELWYL